MVTKKHINKVANDKVAIKVTRKAEPVPKLDNMEIVKRFLDTSIKMDTAYHEFWRKLYRNDAYVMYKNAILFYKNIQKDRFHEFYSGMINKRLYTGKCIVASPNQLKTFNSKSRISSDELCSLTLQVINILDSVFESCPRIPDEIIVFRRLRLDKYHALLNMKTGDYYRELGILSTTLNPYYTFVDRWSIAAKKHESESHEQKVFLSIIVPKGTRGYYINIPFTFDGSKDFVNEFEVVLPRDCVFLIKSKAVFNNRHFITLELVYQVPPRDHPVTGVEDHEMISPKVSNSDLTKWGIGQRDKKTTLAKYAAKHPECTWMLDIAKYSHAKWLQTTKGVKPKLKYESEHYSIRIPRQTITLSPTTFWIVLDRLDPNFKSILNNKKTANLTREFPIIIKRSQLDIHNYIAEVSTYDFTIRDPDDKTYGFYEVNRETPLAMIIQVENNSKPIKHIHETFAHEYYTNKIKLNITSVKRIPITGDYNYVYVNAVRV
jgi:hypothetical protein